jgi:hypothetical protein
MFKILKKMAVVGFALALVLLIGIMVSPKLRAAAYNQYQATGFGDISVANILVDSGGIYDTAGVKRITVQTAPVITGNTTVTGTLTVSDTLGAQYFTLAKSSAPRDSAAAIHLTPTASGQLAFNTTDNEICVSTGTTYLTWVRVSSNTVTACQH